MSNMYRPSVHSNTANTPGFHSASDESRIALFNALGNTLEGSSLLQSLQAQQQQRNAVMTNLNSSASSLDYSSASAAAVDFAAAAAASAQKRKQFQDAPLKLPSAKRIKKKTSSLPTSANAQQLNTSTSTTTESDKNKPADPPVLPSNEGISIFNDSDVLSGRGGGTNVHPGNRQFRDLINLHRRSYLKARKNDKPAISRAIVKSIRDQNGRFLKREDSSGLWYEIGDDAAREKTSQALRQRAPEMRKILFESEREQARQEAEEQFRAQHAQQQFMHHAAELPLLQQQMLALQNQQKLSMAAAQQGSPYTQNLMTAALLGGGINRFAPNGA